MSQDEVVPIAECLRTAGLDTPAAASRGRALLEQAGLTRPGKQSLAANKLDAVRAVLGRLALVCGQASCARAAHANRPGAELVVVSPGQCAYCGGSDVVRAVQRLLPALRAGGVGRLLVLGGTPAQHRELAQLLAGAEVALRCVDGSSGAHSRQQAGANLDWADLVVIWASTPLAHKVSQAYTNSAEQRARAPQVTVARRSLTALCDALVEHLQGRAGANG